MRRQLVFKNLEKRFLLAHSWSENLNIKL
jgi:hypothetical protein